MTKTLVLFDFDGTLTSKDSFLDFLIFAFGRKKILMGSIFLAPLFLKYLLKIINNNDAKEIVIKYFFKDWKYEHFKETSKNYAFNNLPSILRPKALDKLQWHINQNHNVSIVTASIEEWIKPWADHLKIDLLSTKLEIKNGKITGNFIGPNCFGYEKVKRIKEKYNLKKFHNIYAYGDSSGDKEMMKLAKRQFYKPFR